MKKVLKTVEDNLNRAGRKKGMIKMRELIDG